MMPRTEADITELSDILRPLFHEARMTTETIMEHAASLPPNSEGFDKSDEAILGTVYTMAFEAGLAMGLAYPDHGRLMLDAIDKEVLDDDPQAQVERARYLDHLLGRPTEGHA